MDQKIHVVLITGGSCSGKSVFSRWFTNSVVLTMDSFYIGQSKMKKNATGDYDFDHPDAFNIAECAEAVRSLVKGQETSIPIYEHKVSERVGVENVAVSQETRFIVVEGLFTFYSPLIEMADWKIFVDAPSELRLARRMIRDVHRQGRSKLDTVTNFIGIEKNYQLYIEPKKKLADLVIPYSYNLMQFSE